MSSLTKIAVFGGLASVAGAALLTNRIHGKHAATASKQCHNRLDFGQQADLTVKNQTQQSF